MPVGDSRPRGRPRKLEAPTIEGVATEVRAKTPARPASATVISEEHLKQGRALIKVAEELKESQREIRKLQAENDKLREQSTEPEVEVQPFGSGDTVTVQMMRNRPDVNFWTGLMLAVGEWAKLGSLEQHRYLNMDDLREHKKEALRRAA